MELVNEFKERQKQDYLDKLTPLFAYIPYLHDKEGAKVRSIYEDSKLDSIPVPVYDSTTLAFVKAAQNTGLIDRNYVYAYNKVGARKPKDERLFISGATFKDIDAVISIMAKYVLGGMSKGAMWSEAVEEGIWLHALIKLKELLEIYDHPLA